MQQKRPSQHTLPLKIDDALLSLAIAAIGSSWIFEFSFVRTITDCSSVNIGKRKSRMIIVCELR